MPERADRSLRQRDSQARDHQDLADPASSLPSTNRHDVLRDTGIRHTYTGPITSFGVSPETHTVDYNVIRARIDITPGAVTYDYGVGANYRDLLQSRTMESLAQKLASGRDLTKEELNFLAKTSPNDNRSWQSFHHSMMLHADSQTFTRALNPEELRQIVFKDLFGNEAATHSFMPGEIAEELQKRPLDLARIKELTALVDPNNEQAFDTAIKTAAARHHALKIVESALDFANHKLNSHTGEIAETALKDLELSPEEIEQLELENAKEKNKDYKGKLKAFSEEFALGAYPEIQELNDIDIKKYKDHFSSQIEEISKIAEKERTKEQINTLVQSQQAIKECERLEKLKELKSTILAGDTSDLEKSKAIDEANKIIEKLTSSEARVLLNPQFFKDHPELAEKGLSCLASNAYLDTEAAEKSNAEVQQHLKEKLTSFYRSKIDSRLKAAFPESYDSLDNNDSYQIVLDNLARNYADRFLTLHSVDTEKTKAFYEAMQKKNRDPEDSQKNAAFIAASKELAEEEKNPTANFDSRSKELMSSIQTLHAGVELVSVLETVKGNIKAALYGEKGRTQEEIDSILDEFTKIISKPERLRSEEFAKGSEAFRLVERIQAEFETTTQDTTAKAKELRDILQMHDGYNYQNLVSILCSTETGFISTSGEPQYSDKATGELTEKDKFNQEREQIRSALLHYTQAEPGTKASLPSLMTLRAESTATLVEIGAATTETPSYATLALLKNLKDNQGKPPEFTGLESLPSVDIPIAKQAIRKFTNLDGAEIDFSVKTERVGIDQEKVFTLLLEKPESILEIENLSGIRASELESFFNRKSDVPFIQVLKKQIIDKNLDPQIYQNIIDKLALPSAETAKKILEGDGSKVKDSLLTLINEAKGKGIEVTNIERAFKSEFGTELSASTKQVIGNTETAELLYLNPNSIPANQLKTVRDAFSQSQDNLDKFWKSMELLSPQKQQALFKADSLIFEDNSISEQARTKISELSQTESRNADIRQLQMIQAAAAGLNPLRAINSVKDQVYFDTQLNTQYRSEVKTAQSYLMWAVEYAGLEVLMDNGKELAAKYPEYRKQAEAYLNNAYGAEWTARYSDISERLTGNVAALLFAREKTQDNSFSEEIELRASVIFRGPSNQDENRILLSSEERYYDLFYTPEFAPIGELAYDIALNKTVASKPADFLQALYYEQQALASEGELNAETKANYREHLLEKIQQELPELLDRNNYQGDSWTEPVKYLYGEHSLETFEDFTKYTKQNNPGYSSAELLEAYTMLINATSPAELRMAEKVAQFTSSSSLEQMLALTFWQDQNHLEEIIKIYRKKLNS